MRRSTRRIARAAPAQRPDDTLPEAGASRRQRVPGRDPQVRADAPANHGRGELGDAQCKTVCRSHLWKYEQI